MSQFVEEGHLGGYVPGGDEATYYPDLWRWLVDDYGVDSVLDVGCGDGVALNFFKKRIKANKNRKYLLSKIRGIEGVGQADEAIIQHDYTTGPCPAPWHENFFDLIWCCEFVEHVEEQYVPNFLDTFTTGKTVLMTHAEPGQQGYHHVNCQPASYWVQKMREIGYTLNSELTIKTRELAGKNTSPWNHYVRSGLAFERG